MKLARFFFAILAIVALSAGSCSDLPTDVESGPPQTDEAPQSGPH